MIKVNDKVLEKPQRQSLHLKTLTIMSDKTQILPDSSQPQTATKEEMATSETNTDKKRMPKLAVAVGAGIVAGVGAISWDTYGAEISAEIEEETTSTNTMEEQTETTAATDSTSTNTTNGQTNSTTTETHQATNETHDNVHITAVPDHLAIANMPDSMSFDEAFSAARQSMGAGALFEWRGELYHTCHPDEYAALSQEMKNLFADAWTAHESHTDGVEVVPEEEGVAYVFDLNSSTNEADQPTDTVLADDDYTPTDDYTAYTDENPVDADYDNDYDGADDFINPEDIVA